MLVPLTQEHLDKARALRESGNYPAEIVALQAKIEKETRLAMFFISNAGGGHPAHFKYIVELKLQLDALYGKILMEG